MHADDGHAGDESTVEQVMSMLSVSMMMMSVLMLMWLLSMAMMSMQVTMLLQSMPVLSMRSCVCGSLRVHTCVRV